MIFSRILRAAFSSQDAVANPKKLIDNGANPYQVWAFARGFSPEMLAVELDTARRYAVEMPGFENTDGASLMKNFMLGHTQPDPKTIYEFCLLANITPGDLLPENHPLPAPGEIVEAAVMYALEAKGAIDTPNRLYSFLRGECLKSEKFGGMIFDGQRASKYMNDAIEDYQELVDSRRDDILSDDMEEQLYPIEQIKEGFSEILTFNEGRLQLRRARELTKAFEQASKEKDKHAAIMSACRPHLVQCRDEQDMRLWLDDVFVAMKKFGPARLVDLLQSDPARVSDLPAPRNGSQPLVRLPNGKSVIGYNKISHTFCDAFRAYEKTMLKMQFNEEERDATIEDLLKFQEWRKHPQTAVYLQARANSVYITETLEDAQLDMLPELSFISHFSAPRP